MLRLFTGLFLPQSLVGRISMLQGGIPGAKWVEPDNYHITLNFIGEADEETAELIDEVLSGIRGAPFTLRLQGTGTFDKGEHMEALWLGIEKNDALMTLQEKMTRGLEKARVPVVRRKYTPHMTLARLKNAEPGDVADFIRSNSLFTSEPFEVEDFILYQSHQTKAGAQYEPLKSYPL